MSESAAETPPCPNHHIHNYTFSELELNSPTKSNEQPYFRALVFLYKKPGLTDEFFHEHWKSVHADLTVRTKGAGVHLLRYSQFHMEPKNREEIQPLLDISGGSMQLVPYDGCAEFVAKSAEEFTRFMKEVYDSPHLIGCGKRFCDLTKGYHVMCGYENLIFGQAIPTLGGKDGILACDPRLSQSATGEGEARGESIDGPA